MKKILVAVAVATGLMGLQKINAGPLEDAARVLGQPVMLRRDADKMISELKQAMNQEIQARDTRIQEMGRTPSMSKDGNHGDEIKRRDDQIETLKKDLQEAQEKLANLMKSPGSSKVVDDLKREFQKNMEQRDRDMQNMKQDFQKTMEQRDREVENIKQDARKEIEKARGGAQAAPQAQEMQQKLQQMMEEHAKKMDALKTDFMKALNPNQKSMQIDIVGARYGTANSSIETAVGGDFKGKRIADIVREKYLNIDQKTLTIPRDFYTFFGDPLPGTPKNLMINVIVNGNNKSFSFPEGKPTKVNLLD